MWCPPNVRGHREHRSGSRSNLVSMGCVARCHNTGGTLVVQQPWVTTRHMRAVATDAKSAVVAICRACPRMSAAIRTGLVDQTRTVATSARSLSDVAGGFEDEHQAKARVRVARSPASARDSMAQ